MAKLWHEVWVLPRRDMAPIGQEGWDMVAKVKSRGLANLIAVHMLDIYKEASVGKPKCLKK